MEPKVCLALGGGAARGLAHLGVLKVFEDAKLPIHMIAGTSLGALMGRLYASHPDAHYWITRVEQYLHSFRSRKTRLEFIPPDDPPSTGGAADRTDPPAPMAAAATLRSLADLERDAILHTLQACRGNSTASARALGISVRKLQYRLKEYAEQGIVIG